MKGLLVLADGTCYSGECFGKPGETVGELVFNTSMTGYQQIITDPSYKGQIVTMTYPLVGNYGINDYEYESDKPHLSGFIIKEFCKQPSNYRSIMSLEQYFINNGLLGISGIDTRAITHKIREQGNIGAVISTISTDINSLVTKAKNYSLKGKDLVSEVTCKNIWHKKNSGPKIAVLDMGIKKSILDALSKMHCSLCVMPAHTDAEQIMDIHPDGLVVSNGPGDPASVKYAVNTISKLIGKLPIMGICLGHQLIALSLGAQTYKLKFGHHGSNHPVKDLNTGKIFITSQNHNYAVNFNKKPYIEITQINLNDNTIEGFKHKKYPIIGLQYHPEGNAGPLDSKFIFKEFMHMIKNY